MTSCVQYMADSHIMAQLFVYLRRTTSSYGVKSYYASNFHSTVRLDHMLHVCVLMSRDILYHVTWNFYSVSSDSKLSSPVNLASFRSFVAGHEFREITFETILVYD